MKKYTKRNFIQKIVISIVVVVMLFMCIVPNNSYAGAGEVAGGLLKEIVQLFASIGDIVIGALNYFILGTDSVGSTMLPQDDANLQPDSGSWLVENIDDSTEADVVIESDYMDEKTFLLDASSYQIPNMLYSPENIFADNISALDINFLNPNEYSSVIKDGEQSKVERAEEKAESAATVLQTTIASWYKSFRNIAIVGLLSVLVYLAIRILISSTATDKAKYKESLRDWFVALCLVFVIHVIMSGILLLTDTFNSLFTQSIDKGIIVQATHSNEGTNANNTFKFRTNIMGLARFKAQADKWQDAAAYTLIYLALVIYTGIFTVMYLKRYLWMAFFTMIAPLVALTYPLDKAGDGHAQAFNLWFKEYTMNAIIQPVHLILYTVFVSSAIDLATENPIYAIVAIGFLVPAEKFVKKMFGLDQANTESDFGSFAGGALAMSAVNKLAKLGGGNGRRQKGGENKSDEAKDDKIKFAKNDNAGKLDSFNSSGEGGKGNSGANPINGSEGQEGGGANQINGSEGQEGGANPINGSEGQEGGGANPINGSEGQENAGTNPIGGSQGNGTGRSLSRSSEKSKEPGRKKIPIKTLKKGGKTLLKGMRYTGKGLARAAGTIGGATVGLAAGLTTGDMSKAMQFAATGAVAGNVIGKNAVNMAEGAISGTYNAIKNARKGINDLKYTWDIDRYGPEVARQHRIESQNKNSRRKLLKNEDEQEKAREWMGKVGYNGSEKEYLSAKADLLEAGVREDMIDDVLKTEYSETGSLAGKNHQGYVDVASFISKYNYTSDSIEDKEKMKNLEERVQTMVSNPNDQLKVMQMTSKMLGADKIYEKRRQKGKTKIGSYDKKKPEDKERRRKKTE